MVRPVCALFFETEFCMPFLEELPFMIFHERSLAGVFLRLLAHLFRLMVLLISSLLNVNINISGISSNFY